ncbi:MAG: hypothetical protein ACQEXG_04755 [Pseudomonadota bacterium]
MLGYPETYPRVLLRRLLSRLHRDVRDTLWSCLRALRDGAESAQLRLDARLCLSRRK